MRLFLACLLICIAKAYKYICPEICYCSILEDETNCKGKRLDTLPVGINSQVQSLDLSENNFISIPENLTQFKNLRLLNLSRNRISALGSESLRNLKNLKILDISYNLITDWSDIHVQALVGTPKLLELNLSHNPLRGFPDLVVDPLKSDSLETLLLVNCSITNIFGDILLGMPNVQKLILSDNLLATLNTQIKSSKLRVLDLTRSGLQRIQVDAFVEATSLEVLLLSQNYQLKKFSSKSKSLQKLDLSNCNLESVPGNDLPNLTHANYRNNHLRYLPGRAFSNSPNLQVLEISNNAISRIDANAFQDLQAVQSIDLSFNTLSTLNPHTFSRNIQLAKLKFSHNYLTRVEHFIVSTLKFLDLSVNEIGEMDRESLISMPLLEHLNMSRNLLPRIPNYLRADKLTSLDLSLCRISVLTNCTFVSMINLRSLNLAGNRLISDIRPSFFPNIINIHLDDNSWRCDCRSREFKELYEWLLNGVQNISELRCQSPENLAGKLWGTACEIIWYELRTPPPDRLWMYSLSMALFMIAILCVVVTVRRAYQIKELREREAQEQERAEARDRLRIMRQQQLQQSRESAFRNAPDPRELQRPPSYAEAVLLPPIEGLHSNLADNQRDNQQCLHGSNADVISRSKTTRKRRRHKSNSDTKSNTVRQNGETSSSDSEAIHPVYVESDV